MNDDQRKNLWVILKEQLNIGDTVVDVYYRLPDQEEEVDKAFCGHLEVAL